MGSFLPGMRHDSLDALGGTEVRRPTARSWPRSRHGTCRLSAPAQQLLGPGAARPGAPRTSAATVPRRRPRRARSAGTAAVTRPISAARAPSKTSPGQVQLGRGARGQPRQHGGGDHRRDHAEAHLGERERRLRRAHRDVGGGDEAQAAGAGRAGRPGRRPASGTPRSPRARRRAGSTGSVPGPNAAAVSLRSAPEQKTGPVWVSTTTRTARIGERGRASASSSSAHQRRGQRVAVRAGCPA